MFVLVPFFAWLVSLVRRRAGRRYPHHVIFACHVFAVLFGVQAIAVAIGYVSRNTVVKSVLAIVSLAFAFIYMILAMRAVPGGSTARAFAHTLVVLAFYWLGRSSWSPRLSCRCCSRGDWLTRQRRGRKRRRGIAHERLLHRTIRIRLVHRH